MSHKTTIVLGAVVTLFVGVMPALQADPITEEDEKRWEAEFQQVVQDGRKLWTSPELGTNGVVCAQCHPNAANTHPETYPKFQQQLGKVAPLWEMVNWCIRNPVQGKALDPADPKMIAIQSYLSYERRGVPLTPGKH